MRVDNQSAVDHIIKGFIENASMEFVRAVLLLHANAVKTPGHPTHPDDKVFM
ncbi:MAG: hypothetical protein AB2L21_10235 [Anaerolineaceae bacterium]